MKRKDPFILIKNIHDKFEAHGNNECQKVDLTLSQFRILVYLVTHTEKVVTQREIELDFKVSHPTINGILGRMEEKGLITTSLVKQGKQQKQVFLTEKGKETLKKVDKSRMEDTKALRELFSETELEQFSEYLSRMLSYCSKLS